MMKAGFALPQVGKNLGPQGLRKVAEAAESLGYDSVWVLDRILWPIHPQETYPATPDGILPEEYQAVLDPIETLTYAAAVTKRVRLGTSILVLPYLGPVLAARRLATLDVLSEGRVMCGAGAGWSHDEFEACGLPFKGRDERMAELLNAVIAIWTQDPVEFSGKYYRIPASKIGPKPVQKPHPPIYQAAHATRALIRAAQLTQGWNAFGPSSWDLLASQSKILRDAAAQAGKSPTACEVVLRTSITLSERTRPADGALFTGTLEQIKADTQQAASLGVAQIIYDVQFNAGMNVETMLKQAEQLRALV
jgi:probable F420-dependent oxidoreductase